MPTEYGIQIAEVHAGSLAEKSGFLPGDNILYVNSAKIRDTIDFLFHSADHDLDVELKRNGKKLKLHIVRQANREFGIDFKPFKVMTCRNNCIFCFVKQLPKGLRKTLYLKDEDYRLSFLCGNYITLTNLSKADKKRIIEQRLSPLYISVHATNRALRNKLIGNSKAPDVVKELKFLADHKIRFNVQIVLCPGYNDGRELQQTIRTLYKFYPYLLSIAVVPVGLTIHRKQTVTPVEKKDAVNALKIIGSFQKRFIKKHGIPIVYGADELYLKAEEQFPPFNEYDELHQIENGVGLVPLFLSTAKKTKLSKSIPNKKFLTVSGISFTPFLKKFAENISRKGKFTLEVTPVENRFFGPSVTVAGLITGRDVIRTLLDKAAQYDFLLVPDIVLNEDNTFLDDITLQNLQEVLGVPIKKVPSTPEGLIQALSRPLS
jgi:putative radical SAM enzyme (TIGR03279 family)